MSAHELDTLLSSPRIAVLKRDGRDLVLADERVVIKCRQPSGFADRLRSTFGRGRLARQAAGAAMLAGLGIRTATVLGAGTAEVDGTRAEVLVLERLAGQSLLRVMANGSAAIDDEFDIAGAVARQLAALLMAGMYNRDHKPSNLIVSAGGSGSSAQVSIIDTVDILPIKPRAKFVEQTVRMLSALMLEPTGCACVPRRTIRRRMLRDLQRELWRLQGDAATAEAEDVMDESWEIKSSRAMWKLTDERMRKHLQRHGTAVPEVDPLGMP